MSVSVAMLWTANTTPKGMAATAHRPRARASEPLHHSGRGTYLLMLRRLVTLFVPICFSTFVKSFSHEPIDEEDLIPSYIRHVAYGHAHSLKEQITLNPKDTGYGGNYAAAWWTNNWEPSMRCLLDKRIGAHGDGGKYICDPDVLLPKGDCVFFSIGGQMDWRMEVAVRDGYGCRSYTFDHTIHPTPSQVPENVTWYKKGLGVNNGDDFWSLRNMSHATGEDFVDIVKVGMTSPLYCLLLRLACLSAYISRTDTPVRPRTDRLRGVRIYSSPGQRYAGLAQFVGSPAPR